MVRTRPFFGLLLILCSLGIPACAMPPSDSSGTSAAAQDGAGTVWALSPGDYTADGTLNRWQAGAWTTQKIPGAAGFRPLALTRGGDGFVYALWQNPNQGQGQTPQCLVTAQRGTGSRTLARFPAPVFRDGRFPGPPALFAGAAGDVWAAGDQPLLWHISPDGSVATFPLKPEQYFVGGPLGQPGPATMNSLVDGSGRRWFWQGKSRYGWPLGCLRGVLIWDGKTLAYHPTLPGMPDRPLTVAAPLDGSHLWLGVGADITHWPFTGGALYRLDTRTLSVVPEKPPRPGAFRNVVQVFQASGDQYVLDNQSPAATVLWRKHAGQWHRCVDNVEEVGGYRTPDLRHPWLAEPRGIWLGVIGAAWWLPRNGDPPLRADWRRGVTALNIDGLFPVTGGGILTTGEYGAAEMPPTPQPIRPLPAGVVTGGMGMPKGLEVPLADPRHHLWGVRSYYGQPLALAEWDGKQWRTHLPPKDITGISGLYACDTRGRLWMTTSNWHPPAQPQPVEGYAVYDPALDSWTDCGTWQEALGAAAALPGMAFLPCRDLYQPPIFSGDGRVTYSENTTIFLYDGHAWRHWQSGDIRPGYGGNVPAQLHFNPAGHLEFTFDNQSYEEWTPAGGWQGTGAEGPVKDEDLVPPGGPHGLWAIPAADGLGAKWFVWQGAVYTAAYGLWAKQEELSAPGSPFRYGYSMKGVLRDPAGRFFFCCQAADRFDLVVWSPPPVPRPRLSVVPTSEDSVAVRFSGPAGPHWFLWRLNGGAWSAPQTAGAAVLTALPRGDYRLEVRALDRRLLPSAPAAAAFSVRVAPGAQVARWVRALLGGTDDAREAAVAGLVKQPDAALAALRAARPGASEAGRWWIDAAVQLIQGRGAE